MMSNRPLAIHQWSNGEGVNPFDCQPYMFPLFPDHKIV